MIESNMNSKMEIKDQSSEKGEKIKRFIECLIPITACNLKCHYCYVAQRCQNNQKMASLSFSPTIIGKALSKQRLGGTAYISICGAGETLLQKEIPEIVLNLLQEGHFVNITTNGTITKSFNEIIDTIPLTLLSHLHFSFSFHYLELLRINKLDTFFRNIKKIKESGCSFIVQVNLCDEYIPYIDEIKNIIKENTGAYPQLAATRNEINLIKEIRLFTNLSRAEYEKIGKPFYSPLFDYTMQNFLVKRNEFCYAGKWSYVLNLSTGDLKSCYASNSSQNIFKDISKPISLKVIGNNCPSLFCMNSSHFISLGVIPELNHPTYSELRNRVCIDGSEWLNPEMKTLLNSKLAESNKEYTKKEKSIINQKNKILNTIENLEKKIKKGGKSLLGEKGKQLVKNLIWHEK